MITRRGFLYTSIFVAGTTLGSVGKSLLGYRSFKKRIPTVRPKTDAQPTLALSLSRYQEEIKVASQGAAELPESLRTLHGLNRIQAILMEQSGEIVLAGTHDAALPAIELDDLLVALRNAFKVGPEYEQAIGCTIDPTPGTADPWKIQVAKVFGMPAGAPMGIRHLAIDYELKKVSAGLVSLKPNVRSVYEISRAESLPCQAQSPGQGSEAETRTSTHRFWFTPLYPADKPRFLQDDQGVWIRKPINVQVQTEEEFLRNGRRVGSAPPHPAAVNFTKSITELLGTNEIREYAQLRNDFRVIEVAKIMQFKKLPSDSLRYLLEDCPLRRLVVQSKVGGIRRMESGEAVCSAEVLEQHSAGGTHITMSENIDRYSQEYRSGVEANVAISVVDFGEARNQEIERLRLNLHKSRPAGSESSWTIRT